MLDCLISDCIMIMCVAVHVAVCVAVRVAVRVALCVAVCVAVCVDIRLCNVRMSNDYVQTHSLIVYRHTD